MLNACVSHELRNPLNSIKARNMEKSYLYKNLINLMKEPNLNIKKLRSKVSPILKKLIKGKKVQEVSCQLMTLNVQDLLDYAQINANKFLKNISRFDIIIFIENVINM